MDLAASLTEIQRIATRSPERFGAHRMIIVTGGAGFIGSAFLKKLNDEEIDDIIVVDSLGSDDKWKNLSGKQIHDYLDKADFIASLDKLPDSVTAIVHLGACSSTTEQNATYMMQNNYHYTKTLAEYALSKKIRFIYASSAATYGDGAHGFSDAHQHTFSLRALNIYAYSKLLFDQWAIQSGAINSICGIRYFNVFGPNEYHKGDMRSVVLKAYEQIKHTGSVKLFRSYLPDYKDGEQKRDFVYVKDCSDALWWMLQNKAVNGIYNLGSGTARTWIDLVNAVFVALEKKPQIEFIEMPEELRSRYQYFTEAPMQKLRVMAGFNTPFRSLEESVSDYVTNYLQPERHL